jgi:hypothetical protein
VLCAASLAAIVATVWLGNDGAGALGLYLFTAIVTAVALSGAYSRTPALRELARPLLHVRARWSAWLIAVLAWPLLGAAGVVISRLGTPTQAIGFGSDVLGPWFVLGAIVAAVPATLAWYGFAARRLLESRSALVTAVLVGLVPWLAIVLPASIWSDPLSQLVLGFTHPFDSYVVRSCLGALASGVAGVWILQHSRVSLLPVLVFLSETTVVSWAVFVWAGTRFGLGDGLSWLMVGLHWLLAVALIVQGRMWRRSETIRACPANRADAPNGPCSNLRP